MADENARKFTRIRSPCTFYGHDGAFDARAVRPLEVGAPSGEDLAPPLSQGGVPSSWDTRSRVGAVRSDAPRAGGVKPPVVVGYSSVKLHCSSLLCGKS